MNFNRYLASLLVCLSAAACTPHMDLHSGLAESDANEILSTLMSAGVPAEKRIAKDGISIAVPASRSAEALGLLQAQGLPRSKHNGIGQIFKKDSLISSPLEERVRYLYALSQELERTLATMDGVITARVHIVLPERLVPGEPIVPSSAAVFVKHQTDVNFAPYLPKIRSLVFNSIPGLSGDAYEKVTVVAMPALASAPSAVAMTSLGPFQLDAGSRDLALALLTGLGVLWPVSLVGIYWLLRRQLHRKSVMQAGAA
jgi:type III secretion protein J